MATTNAADLYPISAEEVQRILTNRKIRVKSTYLTKLFRNQEIAIHDAVPIIQMIRPLIDLLGKKVATTNGFPTNHRDRHLQEAEYALLTCVVQNLELWVGGSTEGMLEKSQQVLESAIKTKNWRTVALALGNQAELAKQSGRIEDALSLQYKALALAREKKLQSSILIVHLNAIAELMYERLREPRQALKLSDEVFELLTDGQHSPIILWSSFHLRGRILLNMGQFEEGIRLWKTAQNIGFDSGQPELGIRSANDIIAQLFIKGEYTVALEYARSIEAPLSTSRSSQTIVQLLLIVVRILLHLNELATAWEKLQQVISHASTITSPLLRLQIQMALARFCIAEGDAIEGERYAKESVAIAERHRLPMPYLATALVLVGETYQAQKRLKEAEQTYHQALPTVIKPDTVHRLLANLYEESGNIDAAIHHYLKILEAAGIENRMLACKQLAKIFAGQGDFQQALNHYQHYHKLSRQVDSERYNNRIMTLRMQYRIDQIEEKVLRERQQKEHAYTVLHATQSDLNTMRIALIEHQHQVKTLRMRLETIIGKIDEEKSMMIGELRSLARDVDGTVGTQQAQWQASLRQSNKEFHSRLLARHPKLSPALALLCDCIHSGMTADTIVSVLYISLDALHKRRHRLRKLLNLKPNQQLDSYLQEL